MQIGYLKLQYYLAVLNEGRVSRFDYMTFDSSSLPNEVKYIVIA
jgi:hypothetical protein